MRYHCAIIGSGVIYLSILCSRFSALCKL